MKKLIALLLTAATLSAAELTLEWDKPQSAEQVTQYKFYCSTNGANFALLSYTTNTFVTFTNFNPGAYQFYVTAVNFWGESPPSNILSTPAGKPTPRRIVFMMQTQQ